MSTEEKVVVRSRAEEITHEPILAVLDEILARDADHQAASPAGATSSANEQQMEMIIRNAIYGLPSM